MDHRAAYLGFGILHHGIAIDDMGDQGIGPVRSVPALYPLIAIIGFGSGVDTMAGIQFALVHDMRAGRAHIAGASWFAVAQSAPGIAFRWKWASPALWAWCAVL